MRDSWAAKTQGTLPCFLFSCFKHGVVFKDAALPATSVGLGVGLQWHTDLGVCHSVCTSCCQVRGKQYPNACVPSSSLCLLFTAHPFSVLPHQCLTQTRVITCEKHIALLTDCPVLCSSHDMWIWPWKGTVVIFSFLMKLRLMLLGNMYEVALLKTQLGYTGIILVLPVYGSVSEPLQWWIEWFEAAAFWESLGIRRALLMQDTVY